MARSPLPTRLRALAGVLALASAVVAVACTKQVADGEDGDDALSKTEGLDCHVTKDTAYEEGKPYTIELVSITGLPTATATAHAFIKLHDAAQAAGVSIHIASAFRTMDEQKHLYGCYETKSCNRGNLAAKPGYSNHQNGRALDLSTSAWLAANAGKFGFKRTVPSEAWHYEFDGADPGGPCSGGDAGADAHAAAGDAASPNDATTKTPPPDGGDPTPPSPDAGDTTPPLVDAGGDDGAATTNPPTQDGAAPTSPGTPTALKDPSAEVEIPPEERPGVSAAGGTPDPSSGGCDVAPGPAGGWTFGVALAGVMLARRRRRSAA